MRVRRARQVAGRLDLLLGVPLARVGRGWERRRRVSAITELKVTKVFPSVPSVQCAAVSSTVGVTSVAEHRNRPVAS